MRFAKQFLYGSFFIIIIGLSGGGFYYWLQPAPSCFDNKKNQNETGADCGGSCTPCVLKNSQPLRISSLEIFDNGNKTITAIGEIKNPNVSVGAKQFLYTIAIYDRADRELFSKSGRSFVYPDKSRTVVEPAIAVDPAAAARGEIKIGEVFWQAEADFGGIPEKNLAVIGMTIRGDGGGFIIAGAVKNANPVAADRVVIKAVLFDGDGLRRGASQTIIENLPAFKEKLFTIRAPLRREAAARVDIEKTKIIVEMPR